MKRGKEKIEININIRNEQIKSIIGFRPKDYYGQDRVGCPAFITMITMVLCYSIADGICLGILSYVLIKMMVGKFKDLNPTLYILSIFLLFNYVFC